MAVERKHRRGLFALEVVIVRPYIGRRVAAMRPRWTRDQWPQAYVCTRCGLPVPKYERLWLQRKAAIEKGND